MIIAKGNLLDTPFQFIAHQVNCQGVMGAGLALQIRQKYPRVYDEYRLYCATTEEPLGDHVIVSTPDNHCIINVFGQDSFGTEKRQTDYAALYNGFISAIRHIHSNFSMPDYIQIVIAIPFGIGCGLAGGDWKEVSRILTKIESEYNVVFVAYRL